MTKMETQNRTEKPRTAKNTKARLSRAERVQALMQNFGLQRAEAIAQLKDMGEY